jgi:hypothetical protein
MKPGLSLTLSLFVTTSLAWAQGPIIRSFPLVTTNGTPVGLEHNTTGGLLYTDIGTNDEIGRCDLNGAIGFRVNVAATSINPIGIAIVTVPVIRVYVTDSGGPDVDIYDGLGTYVSSFSVAAQTTFPEGITHRTINSHLYVVDGAGGNKVSEYTTAGAHVADYPINGTSPDGIAWDPLNDTFWIYDSGTDTCREYSSAFVELRNFRGPMSNGFGTGEGVAIIGTELFVCATGTDTICVYDTNGGVVQAENIPYGVGCPAPAAFYESFASGFDLSNRSIRLVRTPTGTYAVGASAATFDPNFSNNLGAGDDQLFQGLALGFSLPTPTGPQTTVDVDSNGRCGWGLPGSDFTESVAEFIGQNVLCPLWDDLNPSAGGAVYFDQLPGKAMVTWHQVPEFSATGSNTVQVQFFPSGDILIVWGACSLGDCLVGFSSGLGIDPGNLDISASLPFAAGAGSPLGLSASARPILGTSANLALARVPSGTVAAGLLVGFASQAVDLTSIGMPACTDLAAFDVLFGTVTGPSYSRPVAYPNDPALLGGSVFWQGFAVVPGINPFGLILSNGLEQKLGNL